MTKRLPKKDVVIVGLGWTGSIMALELAKTGLDVVAIERGPWRDTATHFNIGTAADELKYDVRQELLLQTASETVTARNTSSQTALPMRRWGSFLPGSGVGGSGVHWNGQTWRFLPTDFILKSHLTERYGADFLPAGHQIQDWGVTYNDLEPFYEAFERTCGVSGTAGNLGGVIQPGGNPYEGPRRSAYPTPPLKQGHAQDLFTNAARTLGYHPFPRPSSNLSTAYTNPYGCRLAPCTFCGFCERFGCANYAKATPQTCVIPPLMNQPTFELRTDCEVIRVDLTSDGKHARGVTYIDENGEEIEQPGDLVLLCAYGLFNVRLMLLSKIGRPYDRDRGEGVVGRNYAYQAMSSSTGFFDDAHFNPFAASGALGVVIDDFNGDNFDHREHGFVGGGSIACNYTHGRPITYRPVPPGTPKWGAAWKKATAENYQKAMSVVSMGSVMSYRDAYLDLDPTYTDKRGQPLLRMTFDFQANERKMAAFMANACDKLLLAMGAKQTKMSSIGTWSAAQYQTTHNTGGAVLGDDPRTSAVNRYLQSWDVPNVFVLGASAFPQNAGYNPTGTVGALTYFALDAIKSNYLKNEGPLVRL